jgi:hypothetical protein
MQLTLTVLTAIPTVHKRPIISPLSKPRAWHHLKQCLPHCRLKADMKSSFTSRFYFSVFSSQYDSPSPMYQLDDQLPRSPFHKCQCERCSNLPRNHPALLVPALIVGVVTTGRVMLSNPNDTDDRDTMPEILQRWLYRSGHCSVKREDSNSGYSLLNGWVNVRQRKGEDLPKVCEFNETT